jgi:hypothetical protein
MTSMKNPSRSATPSLAACLGAAQCEAERLYGPGPMRSWQPRVDRRPWFAAAAAVAAAAAATALWLWDGAAAPDAAAGAHALDRVVAMAPPVAPAPVVPAVDAVAPGDVPADAPVAAGCFGAACASAAEADAQKAAPPTLVGAVLPADMEAWALDPQPLVPAADEPPAPLALVNQPDVPDEHDATPADETPPDEAAFEPPAE